MLFFSEKKRIIQRPAYLAAILQGYLPILVVLVNIFVALAVALYKISPILLMALNIAVIYGSTRDGRQGIKAARFVANQLKARGHSVTLIDPLERKIPMLEKRYKEYAPGKAPKTLQVLSGIMKNSDCYVLVSAEYNHSIPPALSNIIDYFLEEYTRKPMAIVTYSNGPFAGVRVGVQLRALAGGVGAVSMPTMFPISKVQDSFDDQGNALDKEYERRFEKFAAELEWYADAFKKARN